MTNGNGNGVWRWVAVAACGILIGMFARSLQEPKDNVTQKDVSMQFLVMQNKIDTLSNEVAALRQSVNQQNTDIAGIAEKVGVTAHPVTAPTH